MENAVKQDHKGPTYAKMDQRRPEEVKRSQHRATWANSGQTGANMCQQCLRFFHFLLIYYFKPHFEFILLLNQ